MSSTKSNIIKPPITSTSSSTVSGNKTGGIKGFFSKKPVRIIFSLIVITAILVGVAFGIMALINALSDKCANQPGKDWNSDLGMCVPTDCDKGKVCLNKDSVKKGNCVANDYCTGVNSQDKKYIPTDDNCDCTISCPEDYTPINMLRESRTQMDADHYGKPIHDLSCQKMCPFNDIDYNGNYKGYCKDGFVCGQFLIGPNRIEAEPKGSGCWDSSQFEKCPHDQNLVCHRDNPCQKNDSGQWYCPARTCSGIEKSGKFSGEELFYACKDNADCNPHSSLSEPLNYQCIKNDGKFEHFKKVGYCENTTGQIGEPSCTFKRNIGEMKNAHNEPELALSCKDIMTNSSNFEAVSAFNPQCPDTIIGGACSELGMCPNNWQARKAVFDGQPADEHCFKTTDPGKVTKDKLFQKCCNNPTVDPTSGHTFCCPKIKEVELPNNYCLNTTKYPISSQQLGLSKTITDSIDCNNNSSCEEHNESFYQSLGIYKSQGEDNKNNYYSGLYCGSDNKCKAWAGFYSTPTKIIKDSPLGVFDITSNDSSKNISLAYSKDNTKCEFSDPVPVSPNIVLENGWPICSDVESPNTKLYWTHPDGSDSTLTFTAKYPLTDIKTGNSCKEHDGINTCLNIIAKNAYAVNNVEFIENGGNTSCNTTQLCNKMKAGKDNINWIDALELAKTDLNKFKDNVTTSSSKPEKIASSIKGINKFLNLGPTVDGNCLGTKTILDPNNPTDYTLNDNDIFDSRFTLVSKSEGTNVCSYKHLVQSPRLAGNGLFCPFGVNTLYDTYNNVENQSCRTSIPTHCEQ